MVLEKIIRDNISNVMERLARIIFHCKGRISRDDWIRFSKTKPIFNNGRHTGPLSKKASVDPSAASVLSVNITSHSETAKAVHPPKQPPRLFVFPATQCRDQQFDSFLVYHRFPLATARAHGAQHGCSASQEIVWAMGHL